MKMSTIQIKQGAELHREKWWECVKAALREGHLGSPTIYHANARTVVLRYREVRADYVRFYQKLYNDPHPVGYYLMERWLKEAPGFQKVGKVTNPFGSFMMMHFDSAMLPKDLLSALAKANRSTCK